MPGSQPLDYPYPLTDRAILLMGPVLNLHVRIPPLRRKRQQMPSSANPNHNLGALQVVRRHLPAVQLHRLIPLPDIGPGHPRNCQRVIPVSKHISPHLLLSFHLPFEVQGLDNPYLQPLPLQIQGKSPGKDLARHSAVE